MRKITTKHKINNYKERYSHLTFDIYSFAEEPEYNKSGPYECYVSTNLHNFNTVEAYNQVDIGKFTSIAIKFIDIRLTNERVQL